MGEQRVIFSLINLFGQEPREEDVMKKFMTILVLLGLLIGMIGSECSAYNYGAPVVNKGRIGCGKCPAVYLPKDKDKHVCSGRTVAKSAAQAPSYAGTTSTGLPSAVPPKTNVATATLRSVCGSCGYTSNDCRCRGNGFSFLDVRTWVNIQKAPYWPSRRRMIYYNNVYSGRRMQFLGGNWGWRGSSRGRWNRGSSYGYVR